MPRGPFKFEFIGHGATPHYRVADGDDNRIATCYLLGNALFITAALNAAHPVPAVEPADPADVFANTLGEAGA